ncbi:uncharacterized protein H6S33_005716 [Morchella sextelata]|uniref:uncharacterized protein n=1 Tax=Morchella sextelata TaxID=1174677 RepID=UPI001D0423B3|nr:uncharacterized protein H6S33_005716 [Morchella sextelata]KAH0613830.1 hypothetical protein H6S33_005716 [Morchella sextelata]
MALKLSRVGRQEMEKLMALQTSKTGCCINSAVLPFGACAATLVAPRSLCACTIWPKLVPCTALINYKAYAIYNIDILLPSNRPPNLASLHSKTSTVNFALALRAS